MRYPPPHKSRTRTRILAAAARLLRRRGLRGATVSAAMAGAGLSHGGFYAHFDSKDDLAAAALTAAFEEVRATLFAGAEAAGGPGALDAAIGRYLGHAHRDHAGEGCPLAALAGEGARASATLRAALAAGATDYRAALAPMLGGSAAPGSSSADGETGPQSAGAVGPAGAARSAGRPLVADAWALLAVMVGGVALARLEPDPVRSDEILRACRRTARIMARAQPEGRFPKQRALASWLSRRLVSRRPSLRRVSI